MKPAKMHVPEDIQELLVLLSWMILKAPKFIDATGHFPFQNREYVFQKLNEGLSHNRLALGEGRYHELMRMSDQMRACFEADPEDKTGETAKGCKIIHGMEELLKQSPRRS
jgi:hypothetical protein